MAATRQADRTTANAPDATKPAARTTPLRTCVVTRAEEDRARMLRFVVGPDGAIVPDLAANLPGRGIWLSARADVLSHARLAAAFSRAARGRVDVPEDLARLVVTGLRRRVLDRIGFARRAGQAVAGFAKAQIWLTAGRAAILVQAADGSADEKTRLVGRHTDVPVIDCLTGGELGTVFGRDFVVHVAIAAGGPAAALRNEAARLAGVLGEPGMAGTVGKDLPDRGKDLDAR